MVTRKCVMELIKANSTKLTTQQKKTIRGQVNAGNICGAYKGLNKILNRIKESEKNVI